MENSVSKLASEEKFRVKYNKVDYIVTIYSHYTFSEADFEVEREDGLYVDEDREYEVEEFVKSELLNKGV